MANGKAQIFDPDLGSDGQYRDLTDAEIREAAASLEPEETEGPPPIDPVVPQGGPTPTTILIYLI